MSDVKSGDNEMRGKKGKTKCRREEESFRELREI